MIAIVCLIILVVAGLFLLDTYCKPANIEIEEEWDA